MTPDKPASEESSSDKLSRQVTISNQRGLHARAAAKFVQTVAKFEADVTVCKDGTEVSGSSIMGLMMLAAAAGCDIEIRASGRQSEAVLDELSDLVRRKFDED